MSSDALEHLIQDVLDGSADGDAQQSLEQLLSTDADARKVYLEYIYIEIAMNFSEVETSPMNVVPMDRILNRQKRRSKTIAGLCSAVAATIGIIASMYFFLPKQPIARFAVAPHTQLTLTHQNADRDSKAKDQILDIGSRLQLAKGTVELNFGSGIKAIITAPADLTLHSKERIDLAYGTAWFNVSADAVGFQVDTPEFLLTDLGTEFAIISELEAMDQIHVITGEVEVTHHHPSKASRRLVAGHAARPDADGSWEEINYHPERFQTDLLITPQPPYIHFRFDSQKSGTLTVEGTHPDVPAITAQLKKRNPRTAQALVPGVDAQALNLNGKGTYIETNWPGISGRRLRTVTCWIQIPRDMNHINERSSIVAWGNPATDKNAKWKVQAAQFKKGTPHVASVSFGTEWYSGATPLDDGKWHHLAVVYYGRDLNNGHPDVAIYVDGIKETLFHLAEKNSRRTLNKVNTETNSTESNPMMIGKGLIGLNKTFKGIIDELYIYEGALSESVIRSSSHLKKAPN